jgi:adenosylhomocysteine nucleosidase
MERWGVVAALPEELASLRGKLQSARRVGRGPTRALEGKLGRHRVGLMSTGDGAARATQGMRDLLAAHDLSSVVAIGIAGGLSDDLAVGDIVVAERVSNGLGAVPPPDPELLACAEGLAGARRGAVHSHSEIAVDPVAKRRLWEETGRTAASVVDLESASFAREAAARGLPYLVLRAVSDSHDEALPLDFNRFRKLDGSSDRGRVLRFALRHPSIVPELLQLRERLRHCAAGLATLVEDLCAR